MTKASFIEKPTISKIVGWMKALGMELESDDSSYAKWKGRRFRVLLHSQSGFWQDSFQVCDGNFDRWANSVGFEISPCPRTQNDFVLMATTFLMLKATDVFDRAGENVNSPRSDNGEE